MASCRHAARAAKACGAGDSARLQDSATWGLRCEVEGVYAGTVLMTADRLNEMSKVSQNPTTNVRIEALLLEIAGDRNRLIQSLALVCVLCLSVFVAQPSMAEGSASPWAPQLIDVQRSVSGSRSDAILGPACNRRFYSIHSGGRPQGQVIGINQDFVAFEQPNSGVTIRVLRVIEHEFNVGSISWSADGRLVASATRPGIGGPSLVRVWNPTSGECVAQRFIDRGFAVNGVASIGMLGGQGAVVMPPDETAVNDSLFVWRFGTGSSSSALPWPVGLGPTQTFAYGRVSISPDERYITLTAAARQQDVFLVFESATNQLISRFEAPQRTAINDARFSSHAELLALAATAITGPRDHWVIITDPQLSRQREMRSAPNQYIMTLAFSGDDRLLATGNWGPPNRRTPRASQLSTAQFRDPDAFVLDANADAPPVRIWDVATGQQVASIDAPDAGISWIDWSRDSRLIAAVLPDHSVSVWTWPTGTPALRLRPSPGIEPALCARFSPDSRMLAVCSHRSLILLGIQ